MTRREWLWVVLLVTAVAVGCEDDPTSPLQEEEQAEPFREFWQGTYVSEDAADHGALTLDVVQTGREVVGRLVFQSKLKHDLWRTDWVRGSGRGQNGVVLGPDHETIDYQFDFEVTATRETDGSLTGSLSHPRLDATFQLRQLTVVSTPPSTVLDVPRSSYAMAFDGSHAWLSGPRGYHRMTLEGELADPLFVYPYPGLTWTGTAMTARGQSLLGNLDGTRIGPDFREEYSRIYEFDHQGEILGEIEIPRAKGLAMAEDGLWSLSFDGFSLQRFTDEGTLVETVELNVPDLYLLEYGDDHFWSVGWFRRVIYKITRTGEVAAVVDLSQDNFSFVAGIMFDGTHIWYGRDVSLVGSQLLRIPVVDGAATAR